MKHPLAQHALYTARRARVTLPLAVPVAKPRRLESVTVEPAAVVEVWSCGHHCCVETATPWSHRRGPWPLENNRAPINFRLQDITLKSFPFSHAPLHPAGTGRSPCSRSFFLSRHTLVSRTRTTTSLAVLAWGTRPLLLSRPWNSGVRVAWSS